MNRIPDEIPLYGEQTYTLQLRTATRFTRIVTAPPNAITEPRTSWLENDAAWISRTLQGLMCNERVNINGHLVERTDAYMRVTFHIDDHSTPKGALRRYTLEQALDILCRGEAS